MADTPSYQVLARKYRPQAFPDLIGQEAMVRTLGNAFKMGRIAHAFMLHGVRGVGKTTTARLIARALNYESDKIDGPSVELDPPGRHCPEIAASRHPDVMEMDAASRTGVNDIREILDGVRYAPVSARTKVYIIDEVHMLSTSAFNALLKTLEEPPEHAKFVFATTEIRKVPVTVLSRCQRFDLKRVDPPTLREHLGRIAKKEKVKIGEDALRLIARAAEGSVRDALSLLDQAIVQGGKVDAGAVRDMLGLADRARTLDLFGTVLKGDPGGASKLYCELSAAGGDPQVILRDLLDHCHDVTRAKALGAEAEFDHASDHIEVLRALAEAQSMGGLSRVWQLLLKAYEETRTAPEPEAAGEMGVMRVAVAAGLPGPEEAARLLAGGAPAGTSSATPQPSGGGAGGSVASHGGQSGSPFATPADATTAGAPRETNMGGAGGVGQSGSMRVVAGGGEPIAEMRAAPEAAQDAPPMEAYDPVDMEGGAEPERVGLINSLADISRLAERKRDLNLKYDIDHFARPVRIVNGQLEIQPTEDAPQDLTARLSRRLQEWTGARWLVSLRTDAEGGATLAEERRAARQALYDRVNADPAVQAVLKEWPDAQIVDIRESVRPDKGDDA